ncbi:hypothetical protein JKP88DRAFT_275097 [Tribonema minus]|uniref:Uncharacterized protein n=1 Tax=Tribonema minus TaxID=303371 RepID=A0A836CMT9_9STRA|nr:hypothetical protein JKP88DRAFT_275097 [Tribonema minus]
MPQLLLVAAAAALARASAQNTTFHTAHYTSAVKPDEVPVKWDALTDAELLKRLPPWYAPNYRISDAFASRLPFTEEVQADIWAHQNPQSCENRTFVLQGSKPAGLGYLMGVANFPLAWAMEHGHILVLHQGFAAAQAEGEQDSYCSSQQLRGWDCFFMPLSNCSDHIGKRVERNFKWAPTADPLVPAKWQRRWAETNQTGSLLQWWRAQTTAYATRLNARTARELALRRLRSAAAGAAPLPLPPGTISVHVRHGDKYKELELMSWGDHLGAVNAAARAQGWKERALFVTTDDSEVAAAVRAGVPGWTAYIQPCEAPYGARCAEQVRCRTTETDVNPGYATSDAAADLTLFSLQGLLTALEATHFAGQRGSNWVRVIDRLRMVMVGGAASFSTPYIDVGASLPANLGGAGTYKGCC